MLILNLYQEEIEALNMDWDILGSYFYIYGKWYLKKIKTNLSQMLNFPLKNTVGILQLVWEAY